MSGLTLGVIAGSSYLAGYTVDRNIDKFLDGMLASASKSLGQDDMAELSVTVLDKERHLFYTRIKASLDMGSAQGVTGNGLIFSFDVHHGPFWFEKNADGDKTLVSGLFGMHYNYQPFNGVDIAINLRHNFLHSGKVGEFVK